MTYGTAITGSVDVWQYPELQRRITEDALLWTRRKAEADGFTPVGEAYAVTVYFTKWVGDEEDGYSQTTTVEDAQWFHLLTEIEVEESNA